MGSMRVVEFADLVSRHRREFLSERIPFSVMVELTHRCNLRCVHCYCPPRAARRGELTPAEFGVVFDRLADAGTVQVCLTGGDPLLRPDFPEIYLEAKKRGFLVVVFTNGALVTDETLDLFSSHWPRRVEISLYGRSAAVFDAVTQVPGAHRVVYDNVRRLVERGIPSELKTVALTLTKDEVYDMMDFAEELDVPFRFDGRVHPRIDGSFKPLAYRLSPSDLASLEAARPKALENLRRSYEASPEVDRGNESIFMCGAGIIAATVDPYGRLHLCTILRKPGYDLVGGELPEIWNGAVRAIRETKRSPEALARAEAEGWMDRCPGFNLLETGRMEEPSEFLRDLASEEKKRIR